VVRWAKKFPTHFLTCLIYFSIVGIQEKKIQFFILDNASKIGIWELLLFQNTLYLLGNNIMNEISPIYLL